MQIKILNKGIRIPDNILFIGESTGVRKTITLTNYMNLLNNKRKSFTIAN